MKALVSPSSRSAVCFRESERPQVWRLDLDEGLVQVPEDVFFANEPDDFEWRYDTTLEQLENDLRELDEASDALTLFLMTLDSRLSEALRRDCARDVEELLEHPWVVSYLQGILYARTMPKSADTDWVLGPFLFKEGQIPKTRALLRDLLDCQDAIAAANAAWAGVPHHLFQETPRLEFRHTLVRGGWFYRYAQALRRQEDINLLLVEILQAPAIQRLDNHRNIVPAWCSAHVTRQKPVELAETGGSVDSGSERGRKKRKRKDYTQADWQENVAAKASAENRVRSIVGLIRRGDLALSKEKIERLVQEQSAVGAEKHLAKSLCNIAAEAQEQSLHAFAEELSARAVSFSPGDVQAVAQHAHALLLLGRPEEALREYQDARALAPDNPVCLNGMAEVYKAMGDYSKALDTYEAAQKLAPRDPFGLTGLAEVYKAMGNYPQALDTYEAARTLAPHNPICLNGLAEIYKALGDYHMAIKTYEAARTLAPHNPVCLNGLAEVYKAMGDYSQAIDIYEAAHALAPHNPDCLNGVAEVHKAMGNYPKALESYRQARQIAPQDLFTRNGMAFVLALNGQPKEALALLPDEPSLGIQDWIGYHIRGMILLRKRELKAARQVFEVGASDSNPFRSSRLYFQTTLAMLALRYGQPADAVEAVASVTEDAFAGIVNVIRFDAYARLNETQKAQESDAALEREKERPIIELREALRVRYWNAPGPRLTDDQIFDRELAYLEDRMRRVA